MPPGRRPKATHLHIVQNTYRRHRHDKRQGEPQPAGTLSEPPGWFTEAQRQVWADALRCAPAGLLRPLDGPHLAVWCVACSFHQMAVTMLNELGPSALTGPNAQLARTLIGIANGQAVTMLRHAAEMGFSPSSRSRVVIDPRPPATNPFDEFA